MRMMMQVDNPRKKHDRQTDMDRSIRCPLLVPEHEEHLIKVWLRADHHYQLKETYRGAIYLIYGHISIQLNNL
jgi:hypothetical protein